VTAETQTSLAGMPGAVVVTGPTELAVPADIQLAVDASDRTVTPAQVKVLKATICAKLSIEQLQLYLTICARKNVDPFSQAYAFPQEEGGLAFGLRIDGMRALAMRTGQYTSRTVETLLVPDGERKGQLLGARATVTRAGMTAPVVEEAYMAEYAKAGRGWNTYPETMIRKVAESKALRAAFPDALSGVYEPAEIQGEP
jgi:RecT family protein